MYLILENIDDRWKQAENTTAYDDIKEAEEVAQELELFDCILVQYLKFL